MSALPFKLNQDRRRHIPEQKRKVTNWREYDESLRRRGSLTVWVSDEAVGAWEAERRTGRGAGGGGRGGGGGGGAAERPVGRRRVAPGRRRPQLGGRGVQEGRTGRD